MARQLSGCLTQTHSAAQSPGKKILAFCFFRQTIDALIVNVCYAVISGPTRGAKGLLLWLWQLQQEQCRNSFD